MKIRRSGLNWYQPEHLPDAQMDENQIFSSYTVYTMHPLYTIAKGYRVTVQGLSCNSAVLSCESSPAIVLTVQAAFFGLCCPDVPPSPARLGSCPRKVAAGQQGRTCGQTSKRQKSMKYHASEIEEAARILYNTRHNP